MAVGALRSWGRRYDDHGTAGEGDAVFADRRRDQPAPEAATAATHHEQIIQAGGIHEGRAGRKARDEDTNRNLARPATEELDERVLDSQHPLVLLGLGE